MTMRRPAWLLLTLTASALISAAPSAQSAKHAITHEDVWLMKRLGTPAVSPDGKWAVVPVAEPAYDDKAQVSDVWLVPTDGSAPPRRLTSTKAGESGAAWSPDGTRLAFSTRGDGDEVAQIYVIEPGRPGPAQRVTSLSTGARTPIWRPDGKAILFNSDVYPGAATDEDNKRVAADRSARKWSARVYDAFPVRDWDRWLDDRRPSLFVQELAPGAAAKDLLATAVVGAGANPLARKGDRLATLRGFGGQMGSGSEGIAAAWAPDASAVIFTATVNRHEAAFADVVQQLWMLDPASGRVLPTPANLSFSTPSSNGAAGWAIFARVEALNDRTYNLSRLWRVSPEDGMARVLTDGFDRSVGPYVVAPDGKSLYFLAEDAGRQKLFTVPTGGGGVREVGALTSGIYSSFHLAGPASAPVAVAVWESAVHPPELVRVDLSTGKASPLSAFNTERAASIDWQPLKTFSFRSAKGRTIHNFLALPPAFDPQKKYPLFVVIHGGPASQWMDQFVIRWNYHLLASPGYVVLLTNYTGSTGFGEAFSQAIQGDPLETPGQEVLEAVDEALKQFPFIDGTRMAAGGASYGGHLTNWLAVSTTRFRALVSHAGLFDQVSQWTTSDVTWSREVNMGGPVWDKLPLWQAQNPIMKSQNLKTPILVTVGERDYRVPMNNALQFWSVLQRQKVPSRLIVFPDENHWVLKGENSRFFYGEIQAWLAAWLK
jgi:dipeptidyl aminopeptidase/acylaminoacyl peptidase